MAAQFARFPAPSDCAVNATAAMRREREQPEEQSNNNHDIAHAAEKRGVELRAVRSPWFETLPISWASSGSPTIAGPAMAKPVPSLL